MGGNEFRRNSIDPVIPYKFIVGIGEKCIDYIEYDPIICCIMKLFLEESIHDLA